MKSLHYNLVCNILMSYQTLCLPCHCIMGTEYEVCMVYKIHAFDKVYIYITKKELNNVYKHVSAVVSLKNIWELKINRIKIKWNNYIKAKRSFWYFSCYPMLIICSDIYIIWTRAALSYIYTKKTSVSYVINNIFLPMPLVKSWKIWVKLVFTEVNVWTCVEGIYWYIHLYYILRQASMPFSLKHFEINSQPWYQWSIQFPLFPNLYTP